MDKKILVENVKKVIDSFKNEGKDFSFVGLIPLYGSSYILSVNGTWLESLTTYQSISIITRRMFDLLDRNIPQDAQKVRPARPQRVKARRRTLWGTLRV